MLIDRPADIRLDSERMAAKEVAEAVRKANAASASAWASSREVYAALHGVPPSGYPDPLPKLVRRLKEAARGDYIDGRWSRSLRGFEWRAPADA